MKGTDTGIVWADIGDVVLRHQMVGQGAATLLLIHEMGGSLESWNRLLPLLAPQYRIVRLDLRGNGFSEAFRGTLTLPMLQQDIGALLDLLGIDGPIVPVGCAVGAAVALHLACAWPQRCPAVVALAPATGVPAERRAALLDRADLLEREGQRAIVQTGLDRGYPPVLREDAALYAATRAQRLSAPPSGVAAMMRMLAGFDLQAPLAALRAPALLLAGVHDQDRPPAIVSQVAAIMQRPSFHEVDAGHFMAIQRPELIAEHIRNFLAAEGLD